ncbi:putative hydro-lyase [Sulfobacillus thermosulfidooxidans]|uniref:putative hydro-lyase n=1 Tax=Sulfobacillus thermosulfidooxidans TaxID=28034 RepID=UPI0003F6E346|nr:putative hydro-lyase [Sulfobacillus thermosulfidooxidans]
MTHLGALTSQEARKLIREGQWVGPTSGIALGYVQANLVILRKDIADDFYTFCQLNPRPMPLLDMTEPGDPIPRNVAKDADLRTDLPRYCVYRQGVLVDEPIDLRALWTNDFVAFVLGCSFTTEQQLLEHGVRLRHLEQGRNVPMFKTAMPCRASQSFHGPLVVSMRPIERTQVSLAEEITSHYPLAHGGPIHIGDPAVLGIADICHPDYGDAIELQDNEVPVFWACGVTPQAVIQEMAPDIAITHAPGHMFITDLRDDQIRDRRSLFH